VTKAGRHSLLGGILGGLVVLAFGGVLVLTGVIDTGRGSSQRYSAAPTAAPRGNGGEGPTIRQIYERSAPGVVFVEARGGQSTSPFGSPGRGRDARGSGFVISDRGHVVTNHHIVRAADRVGVRFGEERESGIVDAKVVGTDPSTDIAVLKVDPGERSLTPLPLGDSSKLKVGDPVIAIGNPFGFDRSVTTGIVSALQRRIPAPNNFSIDDVVQTDAPINPGNSGGPLLDARGRVIGINAQIATAGRGGSSGIGFAVPVNTAKKVVPELEADGKIERSYIGVVSASVADLPDDLNLPAKEGALVQRVQRGSPAEKAGLRAGPTRRDARRTRTYEGITLGGDLIIGVDGKDVSDPEALADAIEEKKPGEKIRVVFMRGREREHADLELGKRPERAKQP
jgi:S1-C subfamily serine protease